MLNAPPAPMVSVVVMLLYEYGKKTNCARKIAVANTSAETKRAPIATSILFQDRALRDGRQCHALARTSFSGSLSCPYPQSVAMVSLSGPYSRARAIPALLRLANFRFRAVPRYRQRSDWNHRIESLGPGESVTCPRTPDS